MTAASSSIMQSATPDRAGMAASIEEVSYELGGAVGVTLMGSILTGVYAQTLDVPAGVTQAAPAGRRCGRLDAGGQVGLRHRLRSGDRDRDRNAVGHRRLRAAEPHRGGRLPAQPAVGVPSAGRQGRRAG
ncbi:hypothetical protein G6F63_015427 [Rhizopus arrhizus]|nr:hypothetical protein G6F63_015427 [Rhizopus arrhizus]